jgi:hypothetical protein
MAYYIFLKSLRSLEESRKNPHVKIPTKSPSTNFQSLDKFKNPILIQKFIFPDFRPGRPRGPLGLWPSPPTGCAAPRRPKAPGWPVQPARRSRLHGKYVFLFRSRLSGGYAFPSVTATRAPLVGFIVSPTPANPGRDFPHAAAPPRRCSAPRMPLSVYSPPSSLPPLNPLQTER